MNSRITLDVQDPLRKLGSNSLDVFVDSQRKTIPRVLLLVTAPEQRTWLEQIAARLECEHAVFAGDDFRAPSVDAGAGQLVILLCRGHGDGKPIVNTLRAASPRISLCVLCMDAQAAVAQTLLDDGADLWLPVSMASELILAFLRAALRRARAEASAEVADAFLDAVSGTLRVSDHTARLRAAEYRICEYLVTNRGRWISESELRERVLCVGAHSSESLVRVHVRSIRKALGDNHACIQTRRRFGYRFVPPADNS